MTVDPVITHLIVGPARHGVVTFAQHLADLLDRQHHSAPAIRLGTWTELADAAARVAPGTGVHLNFTDRLFGSTPRQAAAQVVRLVQRLAGTNVRVTATLHDVPQPPDGGNYRERIDAYRAVCQVLHGFATNSEHERLLLSENGIAEPGDVVVVPLPLQIAAPSERPPRADRAEVAVLGFVYPGKGHAEVLAALAGPSRRVDFVAIGECSAGHHDLAARLADAAHSSGVGFTITGFVPDDRLSTVLQRVSVPVAHHRHISASGSLNSWIAAGRRPLASANRYTTEHLRRHPETLRLYPDTQADLAAAIDDALADPDSTWLAAGTISGSSPAETARRYAETLARWHG